MRLVPISVDPVGKSEALVQRLSLNFPLACDVDRVATKGFGLFDEANDIAWPATYLLGSDGLVHWRLLAQTYQERPLASVILEAIDQTLPK